MTATSPHDISAPSTPTGEVRHHHKDGKEKKKAHATTGLSAAMMRALTARMFTFYFRAPMKAFFRARVDYMGYARAINPHVLENPGKWSWHATTPGLLTHAVRTYGWSFIPNQVLPPLMANALVGSVLYASYLQSLSAFHEPSSYSSKRVYPPPTIQHTFAAGFVAGGIQSLVAAPLDALQQRFSANDMLEGKYKHMWHYAAHKLRAIGLRGVFAGWTLSFMRDSIGAGLFFSTFETIKSQGHYEFVRRWYGNQGYRSEFEGSDTSKNPVIRPHYFIEPMFILFGGIVASVAQQLVLHPLSEIQTVHYNRLEGLDVQAKQTSSPGSMMKLYYKAYEKTYEQCVKLANKSGSWRRWLYNGFVMNTLRQVPSTSAGLIVFELVRRKYALDDEAVRIQKDGYDILLA